MNEKTSKFKTFRNNAYAVKTIWNISKRRVVFTAVSEIFNYARWLFFSIFFMRYVIGAVETKKPFEEIMVFLGICFVVFSLISLYSSYMDAMVIPFTDNIIYRKLYRKLYAKARNVELRCFEDAEFYNRYTMALENSTEKMTQSVKYFFSVVFGIIASVAAFYSVFLIDNFAILFVISPILGNFFFGGLMNKVYAKRYADNVKNQRIDGYVNRVMHLAEFAKEIRFSNIHRLMMERYRNSVENIINVSGKYAPPLIILNWFKNVTTFGFPFDGIMLYAAYRAIVSQAISLADLAIMFSAMVTCSWILIGLFGDITEALKNGQFLEYFRTFIEYKEKIPEDGNGIMPAEKIQSIEFRNVCFAYKEDSQVVKNLSFKLDKNKIIALVGHNGAGKTTIIKLLFRLYDPTAGEIFVNGVNIKEYNLKAYRKLFVTAFQDYKIMSMSVKDNVLMGVKPESEIDNQNEIVISALKHAGIWDKVQSLPKGIDTILTKEFDSEGAVLSGGEAQKIIVARAFAQKASVKVFDEPSSALDPIAEYNLYKSIMKEIQTKEHDITLFISHRLSSVKDADLILMFENGMLIEQGTHNELMATDGEYYKMFTMQAQNYLAVEEFSHTEKTYTTNPPSGYISEEATV